MTVRIGELQVMVLQSVSCHCGLGVSGFPR